MQYSTYFFVAMPAPRRIAGHEAIPTVAEAGGPAGFEVGGWIALMAPRGTPTAIINPINEDSDKVLQEHAIRERLVSFGFEPVQAQPAEIARMIEMDSRKQADMVRRAKISIE